MTKNDVIDLDEVILIATGKIIKHKRLPRFKRFLGYYEGRLVMETEETKGLMLFWKTFKNILSFISRRLN